MQKPNLDELTSTRFFAAMAVLLGHFNDFLRLPDLFVRAFTGGFGVSFFFVLSGFILCYRYWEDFAQGVERGAYRRYFAARIARVYPSYVMALVLITAMYLLLNVVRPGTVSFPPNPVTSWLANLFALQTFAPSFETQQVWNGPAWSISTEFAFYLTCPLILAAFARRRVGARGLLALLLLNVAFAAAVQAATLWLVFRHGWNKDFWLDIVASRNIFWRGAEFITGVLAARMLFGGHLPRLQRAGWRNGLLLASLAAVAVLNLAPWPTTHQAFLTMRQFRLDLGYMLPFAGIILALAAGPTWLSPLLKRPSWVFLGDISYAIYIYHWIPWTVLALARAGGWPLPFGLVTGVILLTILFSAASYIWYEKPARVYLRRKFAR